MRALGHADLMNVYLDTILQCAESVAAADAPGGPGWLEQEVSRRYDLIRAAVRSDSVKPYSNDEFEAAVTALRTFAAGRSAAVRQMVAAARP